MAIAKERDANTAFKEFLPRVRALIESYDGARVIELGGGRSPSFRLDQLPSSIISYTLNDISAEELALAPDGYAKAQFDVSGDVSQFAGQFDVVFSRTLIEHVRDGEAMHRNILSLLRPGGVAFHMAPTLFAPPFVINRLLPDKLSRKILYSFFPHKRSNEPKFPAYYSWCFGNRTKMERMFRRVGFREAEISTFYGHDYFDQIPIVRELDRAFSTLAARKDWSTYGSYAHLLVRK